MAAFGALVRCDERSVVGAKKMDQKMQASTGLAGFVDTFRLLQVWTPNGAGKACPSVNLRKPVSKF
jgi:hypothetical protein